MRTGFIDDLRNCKRCGSLEHKNDLRDDLCPNCYYDVGRFKEEREKAKADNKWLNKWQKLKEWILDIWKQDLSKELSNGSKYSTKHLIHPEKLLYKMQELEGEDENTGK